MSDGDEQVISQPVDPAFASETAMFTSIAPTSPTVATGTGLNFNVGFTNYGFDAEIPETFTVTCVDDAAVPKRFSVVGGVSGTVGDAYENVPFRSDRKSVV